MAAAGNNKVDDLKKLVVDELVSSWRKALEYYNQVIRAWRDRDMAVREKEEKVKNLHELKEFMDSPEYVMDHMAAYCDPLNLDHPEYLDHMMYEETFKDYEVSIEEATAKERFLVSVVEEKEKELARLVTEKRKYILTFPELVLLAARKAAMLYAEKAAEGWLTDIERRRTEVYNMEVRNQWEDREQRDELETLREEERNVDHDEYELSAEYESVLLKHANTICNRRLHVLTLITP